MLNMCSDDRIDYRKWINSLSGRLAINGRSERNLERIIISKFTFLFK